MSAGARSQLRTSGAGHIVSSMGTVWGMNVRPGFPVGSCLLLLELSCSGSTAGGEDDSSGQKQPLRGTKEEGAKGCVGQHKGYLQPSLVRFYVSNHLCPPLSQTHL